jgi:signal transduction histidine kinase
MDESARILVVDDSEDNRALLTRRLQRRGHVVIEAGDGPAALAAAAAEAPDLILLDHAMPGMSGLETLAVLRRTHDRSALPVIMVTALADEAAVVDCLSAGANDYVAKPVSFPVLTARIEAQLERRRSAAALSALNDGLEALVEERTLDLRRRTRDLSAARDRAEIASRAKSRFLERISHELRTPLNGVIGLADVLRQRGAGMAPEALAATAGEIHRSGLRLLTMISRMIEMTEIDADAGPAGWTDFAFPGLVADAVDHLMGAAAGAPPRVALTVDPSVTRCRADRPRLRQALFNLLANAARFGPADGAVEVRVARDGDTVVVEVADRGPGVPDDLLPILTEPFFAPADRDPSRPIRGAGLGLAVARKAATLHEGRLEIENRAGGGLCARLILPAERFAAPPSPLVAAG